MQPWQVCRLEPGAERMPAQRTGMFDVLIILFGREPVNSNSPFIGRVDGKWYYDCSGQSCGLNGWPATPEQLAEFVGPFDSLELAYTTFILEAGQP